MIPERECCEAVSLNVMVSVSELVSVTVIVTVGEIDCVRVFVRPMRFPA